MANGTAKYWIERVADESAAIMLILAGISLTTYLMVANGGEIDAAREAAAIGWGIIGPAIAYLFGKNRNGNGNNIQSGANNP